MDTLFQIPNCWCYSVWLIGIEMHQLAHNLDMCPVCISNYISSNETRACIQRCVCFFLYLGFWVMNLNSMPMCMCECTHHLSRIVSLCTHIDFMHKWWYEAYVLHCATPMMYIHLTFEREKNEKHFQHFIKFISMCSHSKRNHKNKSNSSTTQAVPFQLNYSIQIHTCNITETGHMKNVRNSTMHKMRAGFYAIEDNKGTISNWNSMKSLHMQYKMICETNKKCKGNTHKSINYIVWTRVCIQHTIILLVCTSTCMFESNAIVIEDCIA